MTASSPTKVRAFASLDLTFRAGPKKAPKGASADRRGGPEASLRLDDGEPGKRPAGMAA